MLFKVTNKDNKGNSLFIQGSYSRNTSNDVSSITFQNYDDDSKQTHNIARIAARDAFGSSNLNGYGDLLFMTSGLEGSLLEKMRIKSSGQVCIATSNPTSSQSNAILTVNGDALITSNLVSQYLIVSSNATVCNDLYVASNASIDGDTTIASNLYVYQNADISGTATVQNSMTVRGGLTILHTNNTPQAFAFQPMMVQAFESEPSGSSSTTPQMSFDGTSNDVTLSSNLTVLGNVSFMSNLSIEGHTVFNAFDVSNDIVVNGNATIHSALVVNSNAIIGKDSILVGNVMTMSNVTLGASPSSNLINISGRTTLTTNHPTASAITINQTGQGPLMSVQKNGVNKLHVTNDGYVGINTLNPSKPLEVIGDINVVGDIYQNNSILQNPPTPLSFSPIRTSQKTFKKVVSWINNAKKLETIYVTSFMTKAPRDDPSSSNFHYFVKVYDSTNNIQLHHSTHSNQSPSNLLLTLTNLSSNSLINIELQSKLGTMGKYVCVQNVLLNYA